ncbi:unnamed protein product [Rotaria sp. Silwood1]|nr:unnamed protein product [Rotaria sp. Silwood1]CAF1570700.1 unnamed protein product [Rotaria sp. Silwood1]
MADIWSLGITSIELAKGEPLNSDLHLMHVLLRIPKNPPPQLSVKEYSNAFREFVKRPKATQLRRFVFVSTTKPIKYLIELIIRYQKWKKKHDNGIKSDDEEQSKHDSDQWKYGAGTVKSAINYHHIFSIHYNISFSNNNNNVRCNDEKGVDSFEDLRCLLQNENKRYPNLTNDFMRIMCEHISKINNICQTSTSQNNSITDNNHIQITSGVVKMTI